MGGLAEGRVRRRPRSGPRQPGGAARPPGHRPDRRRRRRRGPGEGRDRRRRGSPTAPGSRSSTRGRPTPVATPAIDTAGPDRHRAFGACPADDDATEDLARPDRADPTRETTDGVLTGASITPSRRSSRAPSGAPTSACATSPRSAYYEVHAGFVHHTVNANSYTRAQVPSLLRGIYAYHTKSRGWSDIGYNFIVDRFGRIWEGRYGGVDRPVVGAHTAGYNEYVLRDVGAGQLRARPGPRAAMLDAYGRLFAWKLSLHGVAASSTSSGSAAVLPGRSTGTATPGRPPARAATSTRSSPDIRALAAAVPGAVHRPGPHRRPRRLALARPGRARRRHQARLRVVRTGGQTNFQARLAAATGWERQGPVAAHRRPHRRRHPRRAGPGRGAPRCWPRSTRGPPQGTLRVPRSRDTARFADARPARRRAWT